MQIKDEIFLLPPSNAAPAVREAAHARKRVLVFFISGNPGLISYYDIFLTHLHHILGESEGKSESDYYIYGTSLPGFESGDFDVWRATHGPKPPFSLQEQIDGAVKRLVSTAKRVASAAPADEEHGSTAPVRVVLIGHSVGAYILLEIIARWQDLAMHRDHGRQLDIVGGICLFPTVVDIAKSPAGRKAAPLFKIPYFPLLVHLFAKVLTTLLPMSMLIRLIKSVVNMPDDGAHTTATFLKSRYGVWQALYMARDELNDMTHDHWSDELWGLPKVRETAAAAAAVTSNGDSSSEKAMAPKLYFYWAQEDHWMANSTRDAVIASRAMREGDDNMPFMEIATHDVPHAFCLRHSEGVASKCAEYLRDLEGRLR